MYKSKNKSFWFFNKNKSLFEWLTKTLYLILIASMLGFSNAYYNETRTIYDIRFEFKQEQVIENEDEEE